MGILVPKVITARSCEVARNSIGELTPKEEVMQKVKIEQAAEMNFISCTLALVKVVIFSHCSVFRRD